MKTSSGWSTVSSKLPWSGCPDPPERQNSQANSLTTHAMTLMLVLSTLAAICWVDQKVLRCALLVQACLLACVVQLSFQTLA